VRCLSSSILIEECVFKNNESVFTGGGILLEYCESAVIRNCVFEKNKASLGGAVGCEGCDTIRIESTRFIDNTGNSGSAFECSSCSSVTMVDCVMENNRGDNDGTVYSATSYMVLEGCTIRNNQQANGSGVSCISGGTTILKKCVIAGNRAQMRGGAIFCMQDTLFVYSTEIDSNSAGERAGAVFLTESCAYFDSCTVNDNSADSSKYHNGTCGGFFVKDSKLKINNSRLWGNGLAVFVDTTEDPPQENVDATNNWWGNNSGPFHPDLNPYGTGDTVSNHVYFIPWTTIVGIKAKNKPTVTGLFISQYRNHSNGGVSFHGKTNQPGTVLVSIYNLKGRLLKTIDGFFPLCGAFSLFWDGKTTDGKDASGDLFLCRFETRDNKIVCKIVRSRLKGY